MKIWLRYALGVGIGILVGIWLPISGGDTGGILTQLTDIVIRIARFLLFPMVFLSSVIAADELNDDRRLLRVSGETVAWALGAVVTAAIIGVVIITGLEPQRIPPMIQEGSERSAIGLLELLRSGIPANSFRLFVLGDNTLLVVLVAGVAVGSVLRFDREISTPFSVVVDSANRVLYQLNGVLVSVLGFALTIPTAAVIIRLRTVESIGIFGQLILVVAVGAMIVGFGLYPTILYFLDRKRAYPLRWLATMIPTALIALVGGDSYAALATTGRTMKENLGIPRRLGGTVSPFVAIFGRAGTVLVTVAGFLLVIRSYTALEIGFGEILLMVTTAIGYSVLMVRVPVGGVMVLLAFVANRYGRGMESSYLILLPVVLVLERIATFLDALTVGFVTQVISIRFGYSREPDRPI